MMTSAELRQAFLDYFQNKEHTIVSSSSLVPKDDPTLLFTNAGMVQFKDVFLGLEKRPYCRAASSQRCVRAGGKHNDLENVGYTARHHTFFEMLGSFSFGDYFKVLAIQYAWDFLTNVLKIPKEKLWVTVFEEDEEAEKIWIHNVGVNPERVLRCSAKDNFWSMGETGPCGPCTEIYYDHGESIPGGLPGTDDEGDRYVEIWNLVFMQYDRKSDGSVTPLPKPSVDTGMGLERIAAVMQGVHDNYDIDIFQYLIKAAIQLLPKNINQSNKEVKNSLRVLADHIRSTAFLIMDGVIPANEGRGYVLRRIIRRAIRHGFQSGFVSPFFYKLVKPLVTMMGEVYPELRKSQSFIEKTLEREEVLFSQTLDQGMKIFNQTTEGLSGKEIPGDIVFKLYDTYGFPVDLTADIAREKNLILDMAGFESEMARQRKQSQRKQQFSGEQLTNISQYVSTDAKSEFTGYEVTEESSVTVIGVIKNVAQKVEGMILNRTPFYAESGGQVGDKGVIKNNDGVFVVHDTKKVGQYIIHYGDMQEGSLKEGDQVLAVVDQVLRQSTMLNHTATHLLHAALRTVLGEHVQQKGSLVAPDRLRFDFSHMAPVTKVEIEKIESLVNDIIRKNVESEVHEMSPDEAIKNGAMALFGEKYGETVRTLRYGDFSYEVCGGTHVHRTGDIGLFKIISETGVAAGVRRLEAVTGEKAVNWLKEEREQFLEKIEKLAEQQKQLQKMIEQLKAKLASQSGEDLLSRAKEINGVKVLAVELSNIDIKHLRDTVDQIKQKIGSGVVALASTQSDKVNLIVGVTKDLIDQYPANQLISEMAKTIGGKGGGRPDLAQAGGTQPDKLQEAFVVLEKSF